MKVRCITLGAFQVNAYLLEDPATGQCAIVDTGEGPQLANTLANLNPRPDLRAILLTHAHFDHAGGLADLQQEFPDAVTWLSEVLAIMTAKRFRHMPVVDDGGKMIGVVSIGDLVKAKLEETAQEAQALRKYITT